jgi:outer membrane protein assembly factor BamA
VNLPFITRRFSRSIRGTFLENSYTNHTVGVTSYSFIFQDPTLNKKRDIVYLRGTAESAGSLLTGINELRKADKVDGYYQLLGTQYAQFIKAELEFRYLRKLTQGTKVAYRIFSGFGYPYGNTDVLPFEKRYFCGGANSVRAWAVRSLGPGSFNDSASGVFNQTADIKLEANLEYRFRMFWLLEGALFVDAGNIWDIRSQTERPGASFNPALFYNDIAVGYGIGLRFDFTFFVFRVDWGLKGRDPSQPTGSKWVMWHKNQLPADYSFHAFNIGIGYPF